MAELHSPIVNHIRQSQLTRHQFKSLFVLSIFYLIIDTASCRKTGTNHMQAVATAMHMASEDIVAHENSAHAPGPYLTPIAPANLTSCTPQLLGLGAQKAGTDFFFGWVWAAQYHPQLHGAQRKEAHFFSKKLDTNHSSFRFYLHENFDIQGYNKHTAECWYDQPAVHTEITPEYLYHPLVPARVLKHAPQARFLILLRDPTARALSGFNHNWHKGKLKQRNMALTEGEEIAHYLDIFNTTFQGEIENLSTCFKGSNSDQEAASAVWQCLQLEQLEPRDFIDVLPQVEFLWRSIYADQLQRWFDLFPPQRFLIWITEDFIKAPQLHMQQLVKWLGLDPAVINTADVAKAQKYKHKQPYLAPPPEQVVAHIKKFLYPHTQRLLRVLRAHGFEHQAVRAEAVWPTANPTAV